MIEALAASRRKVLKPFLADASGSEKLSLTLRVMMFIVQFSVWLSLAAWFTGAVVRALIRRRSVNATLCDRLSFCESVYGISWLVGATLMLVHIVASYGIVHGWSHQAALEATAEESWQVTGIRAGWGVYVNFAFAATWLIYSVMLVIQGLRNQVMDRILFWFQLAVIVPATLVFESGLLRYVTLIALVVLLGLHGWIGSGAKLRR